MPFWKFLPGLWMMVLIFPLNAQDIRIALFYDQEIQAVVFSVTEGEYSLTGDGHTIAVVRKGNMFHIERSGAGLAVHDTAQVYGTFRSLTCYGQSSSNVFQVKPVNPSLRPRESDDHLTLSVRNEALQLINQLELDKYIPGTVEAEGGSTAKPEYYKAQAVIARTYAIKNILRHAHEGFNLCDGVHCQAFSGKSRLNSAIIAAARETEDEILVDRNREPVVTAYHACCGGMTGKASVEWNRELPYLVPVTDPFCNGSRHRNWTRQIPRAEWQDYLAQKGYVPGSEKFFLTGDSGRKKFLDGESGQLLMTEMRSDFQLKSSYFKVSEDNNGVVLHGHGYGHGLGLCQEGAMEMARVGYSYVDILMFYFHDLSLTKYSLKDGE